MLKSDSITSINLISANQGATLFVKAIIQDKPTLFLVDTGAQVSLIGLTDVPSNVEIATSHSIQLRGVAGGLCEVLGSCLLNLDFGGADIVSVSMFVVEYLPSGNILGLDVLKSMGATIDLSLKCIIWQDLSIPLFDSREVESDEVCSAAYIVRQECEVDLPLSVVESLSPLAIEEREGVLAVLRGNIEVISGHTLGSVGITTHQIELIEGAVPVRDMPRRISPAQRKEVQAQLQVLLAEGVIKESQSPWASPIVIVPKKDWWCPYMH